MRSVKEAKAHMGLWSQLRRKEESEIKNTNNT
jgi:hypothetical protein